MSTFHHLAHASQVWRATFTLVRDDPAGWFLYAVQRLFGEPLWVKMTALLAALAPGLGLIAVLYQRATQRPAADALFQTWHLFFQSNEPDEEESATWGRLVGTAVSMLGLLVSGVLLGVVVTDMEKGAEVLVSGNHDTKEVNHTLLIGWGHNSRRVLREVAQGQECSGKRSTVVILAPNDADREEIEGQLADIRNAYPKLRVIVRLGDFSRYRSLKYVVPSPSPISESHLRSPSGTPSPRLSSSRSRTSTYPLAPSTLLFIYLFVCFHFYPSPFVDGSPRVLPDPSFTSQKVSMKMATARSMRAPPRVSGPLRGPSKPSATTGSAPLAHFHPRRTQELQHLP